MPFRIKLLGLPRCTFRASERAFLQEVAEDTLMTTLPTTTPMRLPRPVSQTPLALGGPPHAQQSTSFQMAGPHVWRVIRSNLWLIIGMLVLSGIGGVGLFKYLDRYYSSFTAL